jgi:predicted aldo/keto reductase-like oxidoreductase
LLAAPGLGWIDGIMMSYNFRLMHSDKMKRAIHACHKAGIGLTAMKTQGGGQVKTDTTIELELAGRFLEKGFTEGQAKLKAVWANPKISSICSQMPNMNLLMSNVAAAMNKTELSRKDIDLLKTYAGQTESDYCAGCTYICESEIGNQVPIGDVMRYLMYSKCYGDHDRARSSYMKLPVETRGIMAALDYTAAERKCPRNIPIGKRMMEATASFV